MPSAALCPKCVSACSCRGLVLRACRIALLQDAVDLLDTRLHDPENYATLHAAIMESADYCDVPELSTQLHALSGNPGELVAFIANKLHNHDRNFRLDCEWFRFKKVRISGCIACRVVRNRPKALLKTKEKVGDRLHPSRPGFPCEVVRRATRCENPAGMAEHPHKSKHLKSHRNANFVSHFLVFWVIFCVARIEAAYAVHLG